MKPLNYRRIKFIFIGLTVIFTVIVGRLILLASKEAPKPQPGSCQLRGETWKECFARWAKLNEERHKTENPQDRQARLNREHSAGAPGWKGPRVFQWVEVDNYLLRTWVTRDEVQTVWEDYGPNQRIFDSFSNEWDLCHELDPQEVSDGEVWYNDVAPPSQSGFNKCFTSRSQL